VQHHHAHILACLAENQLLGKSALGIAWDGSGYGIDNTIWGGEFFQILPNPETPTNNNLQIKINRLAHFRQFCLAGGEKAIKEPRRIALGLLYEIFGNNIFTNPPNELIFHTLQAFTAQELKILQTMYQRQINTPLTSSIGRLFDGIASLTNQRQIINFEGQAAIELEFAIQDIENEQTYPFQVIPKPQSPLIIDWQPTILAILNDISTKIPLPTISVKFHNTLVETIITMAKYIGEQKILLSGGCFQNKYLIEKTIRRLQQENLTPYWHQRIPPNDGSIAIGQIIATLFQQP
jgi:hydrogenase maturation protein HypF